MSDHVGFKINCITYDEMFDVMPMQVFIKPFKQQQRKLKTLFAQFLSKAYTENDVLIMMVGGGTLVSVIYYEPHQ